MDFKINYDLEYTFESISFLQCLATDNSPKKLMEELHEKYNIPLDELEPMFSNLIEIYEFVKENVNISDDKIIYFFKNLEGINECFGSIILFNYKDGTFFTDLSTFNAMDEKAKKICFVNSVISTLELRDSDNGKLIITTDEDFFKYIDSHDFLTKETKYDFLHIYHNFDTIFKEVLDMIFSISCLIKEKEPLIHKVLKVFMDNITKASSTDMSSFIQDSLNVNVANLKFINIYPHLFPCNAAFFYGMYPNERIGIGILFLYIKNIIDRYISIDTEALNVLKALSDKSKLEIVKALKTSSLYGSQIADMLGLTNATVSYHMAALAALDIVILEKDNNRVYYCLNHKKLKNYFALLEKLLL